MTTPSELVDQHWEKRASRGEKALRTAGALGGAALGAGLVHKRMGTTSGTLIEHGVGRGVGAALGGSLGHAGVSAAQKKYKSHFKDTMKSKGVDPQNMGGSGKAKLKDAFKSIDKKWNAKDEPGKDGKQKASIFPGPKGTKEQPHVIMGKKAEKVAAVYDLAIGQSLDTNVREHVKQAYAVKGEFPPGFEQAFVDMEKEAVLGALGKAGRTVGLGIAGVGKKIQQLGASGAGAAQKMKVHDWAETAGKGIRRAGHWVGKNPGTAAAGTAVAGTAALGAGSMMRNRNQRQ